MADGKGVFANEDKPTDTGNHEQLPESLNPTRGQRSNDENGSAAVASGDFQLSNRGNQEKQSPGPFAGQPGEQGDDSEEFALETGQHQVLFDNPHGLEMNRETVLSEVSLFSVWNGNVMYTKTGTIYVH